MDDHNRSIQHAKNRLYTTSIVRFQPGSSFRIFHRHQAGVQIPTDGSAQTTWVVFPMILTGFVPKKPMKIP